MPETKRPLKVFLCHASVDKPKVRELYRYLRRRGLKPWFDEIDLIGGQDWQVEIPKAIATSDAIIICLTKNSIDKEGYVQKEIKFALDKALEMPEGRIYLIPVRFEACEVPFSLSRYQWVDLFDQIGFTRLMKSLKTRASQLERATVQIPKPDESGPDLASTPANNISLNVKGNIQRSTVIVGDKNAFRTKSQDDIKKEQEIELRKLVGQALQFELSGKLRDALKVYYQIKRIDPLFQGIDLKINQLEKETRIESSLPFLGGQRRIAPSPFHKLSTPIIVAIIGALATIIAALLGILPQYIKPAFTPTINPTVNSIVQQTYQALTAPVFNSTIRPSETPTNTKTQSPPSQFSTATSTNCDAAKFIADVNVPDGTVFLPGQSFVKTWRIQNTGTCAWTTSYTIVFSSGNIMSGPPSQNLANTVNPGQTIDISVNLVAPNIAGQYTGYWKLHNPSGKEFHQTYLEITVK